ncbi:MAG: hypothetical protein FWF52_05630 [Candidatus Azobacteroides sp.]|nr:hypothetical protein [Candidatus Azobacteroides sp.]
MANKKTKKRSSQKLSPEKYIRVKAQSFPREECFEAHNRIEGVLAYAED